jgi:hypothetical protein
MQCIVTCAAGTYSYLSKNQFWYTFLILCIYRLDSRSQRPRGLTCASAAARLLGCEFESRRGNGCPSLASVVCCQVEGTASGWSLIQRCPIECSAASVIVKPRQWGSGPLRAVAQRKNKIIRTHYIFMWARTWGSVVTFRSQKGSASRKVGETALYEHGVQPFLWQRVTAVIKGLVRQWGNNSKWYN